ncbi:hypothetical protein N7478_001826 [Penicillium angulare]|uniref:uncharacterized protein n=1 Tax=Penicillium angulare TaxID=116970 RepID=UPI0025423C63|nr:uncharacterized protein N7478_001826 [Penicillium angulare]KAJ5288796.1 hypothetical protein N7478_001826 [Penicillium angulare]
MDSTQSTHVQAPASTSSIAANMSSFAPSATLPSTVSQPANPFGNPSQTNQTLAAPLQNTSFGVVQPILPQGQPLAQGLNHSSTSTFPVASQGINPDTIPRSETVPGTQPATDVYPHQVHSLGGPKATAPFLQDFNLVAEAAKRAQMGIVMRDLESVTL